MHLIYISQISPIMDSFKLSTKHASIEALSISKSSSISFCFISFSLINLLINHTFPDRRIADDLAEQIVLGVFTKSVFLGRPYGTDTLIIIHRGDYCLLKITLSSLFKFNFSLVCLLNFMIL